MTMTSQADIENGGLSRLEGKKEERLVTFLIHDVKGPASSLCHQMAYLGRKPREGEVLTHCVRWSQGIASFESAGTTPSVSSLI
jgi:hypothetical protein